MHSVDDRCDNSALDQLRSMTKVVIDTGAIELVEKWQPVDATTNPSLLLSASNQTQYKYLIKNALDYAKNRHPHDIKAQATLATDKLFVNFGVEILKHVSGRVSTEIDARLSFDTEATIEKAHQIIKMYEEMNVAKERILIKIATTWEGIQAARHLERNDGIHCNMTLLFSFPQAVAAAEAGVTLVSPFVGRILDWYMKNESDGKPYPAAEDPGVKSVTRIYKYYKKHSYQTAVMGASFRNIDEILELAGCDYLTISPNLLEELASKKKPITRKLNPSMSLIDVPDKIHYDEKRFRWELNEDAMATEKLAEGIRKFSTDLVQLQQQLYKMLQASP
jgi:transaldolase